ncbi:MAG: hypothetical protein J6C25_01480 [Treponema sp.]|nr:hypothetical protein [Treponema sp.]MBO5483391.1 hypothetical protein [Spirochaetaceae bacterium]
MKKKILVGLLVLTSVVGLAFAATGICQNYSKGNGLVVTTKGMTGRSSTVVTIKSTVNEDITITSFSVSGVGSDAYTSPVGTDISKRGSITVKVRGSKVSEDQISVTAQTCD